MATGLIAGGLVACGGGSGSGDPVEAPKDGQVGLKPSQPGDLTAYVQRVLRERAAQRQAGSGFGDPAPTVAPAPATGPVGAPTPAFSRSLTQERDVDEPDLLKTDGTHLFSLDLVGGAQPLLRTTLRRGDGTLEERAAVALVGGEATTLAPRGLVLSTDGRTLVVASDGYAGIVGDPCADLCPPTLLPAGPIWVRSLVVAQRFDVTDPAAPASAAPWVFDGRLVDARRVGDHLVVVSEHQPMLAADQLPATASAAEREAAIAATRGADLLPRRRAAGGAQPLLDETDCWVQAGNASLALAVTTITVFDLRAPDLAPASRCFIGGTEAIYMTPTTLILASTRWAYTQSVGVLRYPTTIRTDLHKFSLQGGQPAYRASGDVEGHLGWDAQRKSYRLGEHGGLLRVLSFTGSVGWADVADATTTAPSPATLTVLREGVGARGGVLEAVATLPNARRPEPLGKPGEQVYGVRFTGGRGYVVTFRQVDPLYVLDLADATDPRIAGVLEVPGFSDHLVLLSDGLLLGVGKAADTAGRAAGVKVSLFDVADAAHPRELASRVFGSAGSSSGLDVSRQGLALLQQGTAVRLSLPMFLLDANFTQPRDRLQRLEVDLAAGTLLAKPAIEPPPTSPHAAAPGQLAVQRSVLIDDDVIWLHGGRLGRSGW